LSLQELDNCQPEKFKPRLGGSDEMRLELRRFSCACARAVLRPEPATADNADPRCAQKSYRAAMHRRIAAFRAVSCFARGRKDHMRTPAQIAGHPIHPMLVTLPIGMWVFSLAADLISLRAGAPATWHAAALYSMVGGIIGALAAAVAGLVDLLSLQDRDIKQVALMHMGINLVVVALYVINAWTRMNSSVSPNVSLGLSIIAIALLLVSGWLGGKMVYEAGVAVHASDTAASSSVWTATRDGRVRTDTSAGAWAPGERAMAADSDRPSRDSKEERR
jgi:uncharacterized membrane protein